MRRAFWCSLSFLLILAFCNQPGYAQAKYSVAYNFGMHANDGSMPNGGLLFDQAGNIFGTTQRGGTGTGCGPQSCGTVFELSSSQSGSWTETVIYNFCSEANCADGSIPKAGLIFDDAGNLYGTTYGGGEQGCDCGTVFRLSHPRVPGANWDETVLWSFGSITDDGAGPDGKLSWDPAGNLYGTTSQGGGGVGSVFQLSPQMNGWTETELYAFCPLGPPNCPDGFYPLAGVTFDAAGNLYGTTSRRNIQSRGGVRTDPVVAPFYCTTAVVSCFNFSAW